MKIPHPPEKTLRAFILLGCIGFAVNIAQAQPPERVTDDQIAERRAPHMSIAELKQALGAPTTLTLHVKDAAPQAAFDALIKQAAQSGVKLGMWPSRQELQVEQPVTVDIEAQPFWTGLRTVLPKLGLFLYPYTQQEGIIVAPWSNGESSGAEQVSWPCLFVAHKLERVQVFTQVLGKPQPPLKTDNLSLSMTAFLDPKAHFQARRSSLRLDEMVDEKGHSLLETKTVAINAYNNNSSPPFFALTLRLKQPPNMGNRIARLKATLRLVVASKQETWETPDILNAKEVSKTVDDKTYSILSLEKRGDTYVAHLRMSSVVQMQDGMGGFEAFSNVRLLDAAGHEYARRNVNTNGSEKGMTADITFTRANEQNADLGYQAGQGEAAKLIWTFATQLRTVEVPFEFDNLPLP